MSVVVYARFDIPEQLVVLLTQRVYLDGLLDG